jgi:hypothetical protein
LSIKKLLITWHSVALTLFLMENPQGCFQKEMLKGKNYKKNLNYTKLKSLRKIVLQTGTFMIN